MVTEVEKVMCTSNILCIMDNIEHNTCIINHLSSRTCRQVFRNHPHKLAEFHLCTIISSHIISQNSSISNEPICMLYIVIRRCSIPEYSELLNVDINMKSDLKTMQIIKQFQKCNNFHVSVFSICTLNKYLT
jgi:hypothetical protein